MIRTALAFLLGVVLIILSVMGLQMLGHAIWPLPPGLDPKDPAQLDGLVAQMPFAAKAWILLAYAVATKIGVMAATALAPNRWKGLGITLGVLMTALCAINFNVLPHPLWMVILGLAIPLPVAMATAWWWHHKRLR